MTLLASNENREYAMYNFIYPLLANDNFSILSSTTSNKPHKGNRKKRGPWATLLTCENSSNQ